VKGEEEFQADKDHTFGLTDGYYEEAINTSNICEYTQKTDYEINGFQSIIHMPVSV
jgi:hypothetical protein